MALHGSYSPERTALVLCWTTWLLACAQHPARADAALPSLVFVCPTMLLLLPVIIAIEARIAEGTLGVDDHTGIKIATAANLKSTLLGVPLGWAGLLMGWLFATAGDGTWKDGGPPVPVLANAALWGATTNYSEPWTVYAGAGLMWAMYFLVSVWYEGGVARRYVAKTEWPAVRRWAWQANAASYALLAAAQGLWLWLSLQAP